MHYYISTPSGWHLISAGVESLLLKRESVILSTTPENSSVLTYSKTGDKTSLNVKGQIRYGDPACECITLLGEEKGRAAEVKLIYFSESDRKSDGAYYAKKVTAIVTLPQISNQRGDADDYEALLLFTGGITNTVFMPLSGTYGYEV